MSLSGRKAAKHWRRALSDGDVEFFFSDGKTQLKGSTYPAGVDHLQSLFEKFSDSTLPEVEWKKSRGALGE